MLSAAYVIVGLDVTHVRVLSKICWFQSQLLQNELKYLLHSALGTVNNRGRYTGDERQPHSCKWIKSEPFR